MYLNNLQWPLIIMHQFNNPKTKKKCSPFSLRPFSQQTYMNKHAKESHHDIQRFVKLSFGNLKARGGNSWQGMLCRSNPTTNSYVVNIGLSVTHLGNINPALPVGVGWYFSVIMGLHNRPLSSEDYILLKCFLTNSWSVHMSFSSSLFIHSVSPL